jgi:hypothetical protein
MAKLQDMTAELQEMTAGLQNMASVLQDMAENCRIRLQDGRRAGYGCR